VAVVVAAACVGAGGALSRRAAPVSVLGWAFALVGAWVVAVHGGIEGPTWVRVVVVLVVPVGALLAAASDEMWRDDAPGPALLALSALGAYYAVPDTEQVAAVAGAAVALGALGWPVRVGRLGASGAAAAVALVVWAAATGAVGRPPSFIGAAACLGLLVGIPLGAALARHSERGAAWAARPVAALLVVHAGVVVLASRWAGASRDVGPALAAATVTVVAAVAGGAAVRARPTRRL
jgi:hypothetical protein